MSFLINSKDYLLNTKKRRIIYETIIGNEIQHHIKALLEYFTASSKFPSLILLFTLSEFIKATIPVGRNKKIIAATDVPTYEGIFGTLNLVPQLEQFV